MWNKVRARVAGQLPAAHFRRQAKAQEEMNKGLRDIRNELREHRKYLEAFRHLVSRDVLREVADFTAEHQLGFEATLERIGRERLSFARFGDGELRIMLRPEFNLRFQRWSAGLAAELRTVLTYDGFDPDRLLVGFPYPYRSLYWSDLWLDIWPDLRPLLRTDIAYGTTHVSRPIFFERMGHDGVNLWRRVWQDRDVCIVTGEGSRFEVVPELFDNVASSRFVHSLPVNAYSDLPRLMGELKNEDPGVLYLVALGPAGTLVTAELARLGRWAIDVGHISASWANVFAGGKWPERLELRRSDAAQ
jgi:hypothetical protein